MYKVYIETCGAGLIFESDLDLSQFLRSEGKFLDFPDLKVFHTIPQNCDYVVRYINSDISSINCNAKSIEIRHPISELTPASIVYMGYILMEKQRAANTMVTIHSACIEKDESSVLLLGRMGSGKTSIVLNLCINNNYRLIGNDRTIIGLNNDREVTAFGGTEFIFLRYESIKRNLPELLKFFPASDIDSWLRKTKVQPEDIGIDLMRGISEISHSYIVHVDERQHGLYTEEGDTPANRLYLNELFSMYIRGIYTTFSDKDFRAIGYIPSYDEEEFYVKRTELINSVFENTDLEYVSGNVNEISKHIDQKQMRLVYNNKKERGYYHV